MQNINKTFYSLPSQSNKFIATQFVSAKLFDDNYIDKLVNDLSNDNWQDTLINKNSKDLKSENRICKYQIPKDLDLEHISRAIRQINDEYWKLNISHIDLTFDSPSICKYEKGGLFNWHIDATTNSSTRKLAFTMQLSDPNDYEGGDLQFFDGDKTRLNLELRNKGTIIIFPSFVWHRITPITKGTRYALVGWVHGDCLK